MNKDYYYYKIECTLYKRYHPTKYKVLIKRISYISYETRDFTTLKECRAFISHRKFLNSIQ